jgi:nucleotide-binding universal stress UspA family protein
MNTLLVATDGSLYANSIYDHAAWVANRTGASIHLLHMLDPHHERAGRSDFSGNLTTDDSDELLKEFVCVEAERSKLSRERGKRILNVAKEHLAAITEVPVSAEQQHGELVEAISRMEEKADLLVIGKRGESADLAKMHLGSSLERVLRASTRPVLVASRQFQPINRVLIAYDGGTSIEKAVAHIISEPLLLGTQLHLVRTGKIDANAEWFAKEAGAKLREAGFEVDIHLEPGHPEEVIHGLVQSLSIGLLVMGAYGHSRIRNLMLGSTTTALVRTCLIPVLMFR